MFILSHAVQVATSVMKQMEAQMYELRQEKERLEEAVAHSSAAVSPTKSLSVRSRTGDVVQKRVLAPSAAANSQLSRVPIGPVRALLQCLRALNSFSGAGNQQRER